jgi:DNA-binding FadR family transcriptional regulator
MAFHRQIAALSGNRLLAAVSAGMLEWLTKFKRDMVSVRGADRVTVAEHERITAAIASRDPQAAAAAMTEHMSRANALYAVLAARETQAAKPARTTRRAPPRD